MAFFRNFPIVRYKFGDENTPSLFQNITAYIDLIDKLSDNTSYYLLHDIVDGSRPDTLSHELYGTTSLYWTFYLMNEKLRIQGWPLATTQLHELAPVYYPHLVLQTDEPISSEFYIGETCAAAEARVDDPNTSINEAQQLYFDFPPFKATIIEKNHDMGQLVVKPRREVVSITITNGGSGYTQIPTVSFSGGGGVGAVAQAFIDNGAVTEIQVVLGGDDYITAPIITISAPDIDKGDIATATATLSNYSISANTLLYSQRGIHDPADWDADEVTRTTVRIRRVYDQYLAPHHYEDVDGNWVDLNVSQYGGVDNYSTAGLLNKVVVTHLERLIQQNDELRRIRVLKPDVAQQIDTEFQKLLKQVI